MTGTSFASYVGRIAEAAGRASMAGMLVLLAVVAFHEFARGARSLLGEAPGSIPMPLADIASLLVLICLALVATRLTGCLARACGEHLAFLSGRGRMPVDPRQHRTAGHACLIGTAFSLAAIGVMTWLCLEHWQNFGMALPFMVPVALVLPALGVLLAVFLAEADDHRLEIKPCAGEASPGPILPEAAANRGKR